MSPDLRALFDPALGPLWSAVHDRLCSGRPVSRVRLGPLDEARRSALADLLGRALAANPDSTGLRHATTSDGRVEVLLRAPPASGAPVWLRTPGVSSPDRTTRPRSGRRAERSPTNSW